MTFLFILLKKIQVENDSHELSNPFIFQKFLPEIEKLNDDSTEKIEYFTISDPIFRNKYGITKFPLVIFYRGGNYVTFKGRF